MAKTLLSVMAESQDSPFRSTEGSASPIQDPLVLPQGVGPVHIVLNWIGGPLSIDVMRQAEIPCGENLQNIFRPVVLQATRILIVWLVWLV